MQYNKIKENSKKAYFNSNSSQHQLGHLDKNEQANC